MIVNQNRGIKETHLSPIMQYVMLTISISFVAFEKHLEYEVSIYPDHLIFNIYYLYYYLVFICFTCLAAT
jgi:hypothetical protein